MSYCPRCGRPVPPDAPQCPSCRYDIPAAAQSTPRPAAGGEGQRLAPAFTEGPSQVSGAAERQPSDRRGVGTTVLVSVAAIAVIAVLVAIRIDHRGTAGTRPAAAVSSSPSGSATAGTRPHGSAQASMIAGYLTRSGRVRHRIGAAINAISGCRNVASAVIALRHAAKVRARIARSLAGADVSGLPHGRTAVADLRRAMRASAIADRHYAAWGLAVSGCYGHAPQTAQLAAARRSDARATAVKHRFAHEWNPIAAMYGLPKENANTF